MALKVKIILNPIADAGRAWTAANDLRPIVAKHSNIDWSGTVYPTHATELAKQAGEQGYDMVIAMGGDGTVHEIVNGLMQVQERKRPTLGVVPVGSGNDFANSIGVPLEADHALSHALHGKTSTVDIGLMVDENGRQEYFDNTIGIGFGAIVTIRSHKLPIVRGFLMYLTAVIQTIILNHKPAHMKLTADGESWEQTNLMVGICNGPREGGGFMIAPEAKNDDGILNYVMIKECSRLMMFRLVPEVMKGTHGRFDQVQMGTCKKFSLSSDEPLYIHADGEIFTSFDANLHKVSFEILPNALKVVKG
ncbi:MAG: diacylglycerol kinase family lipid kinase [Anaerolineae bacterium]|nr:diacylglycerol kinase family lipid kinase [Anaerolineae bacterium]MDK1080416.1 diacylglycerol kinase family lipid kinase [Anaerolineae bacterium]MDK1117176.1 diacylglycerol kinase family lipid kinase [Anaerolineae bacterium]